MFLIANLCIGFFIIYDTIFCCFMAYTAVIEEWCCSNPFPGLLTQTNMCFRIQYHKLFNNDPEDNTEDVFEIEI